MSHHGTRWRNLLHPCVSARSGHPHVIAGARPHPHLSHHVGHVLSLQQKTITICCPGRVTRSHLLRHSVLGRRRSGAHPVLHAGVTSGVTARVTSSHHVALHAGHHATARALHHARVAGASGHPTHVHAGAVGTHGVPHHHTVGSHHLHAAAIGHHVGHWLSCPHHVRVLHPHPHHHLLLLTHLAHAWVTRVHLEI